ncbi:Aste57867_15961 [Aphanomyces stellatus]|uniref:Aste57867_15961 protein n=1 Tax=Aphanomyces stellatus TaxID=120398 RepID=A0A485L4B5_9STRA|nr:hypothetical protein As57867_015905 [Aphanomyces stellatus]VFT92746.1 Aste57867_15961 [Aphanomyces stellatus]
MTELEVELSSCGAVSIKSEDYDTNLHVASVFIILGVSLLGALLPVLAARLSFFRAFLPYMRLLNALGVGVIISTSLVHMLPPGIDALDDPCLNLSYDNLALVIAVVTLLCMQILETELVVWLSPPQSLEPTASDFDILSPVHSPLSSIMECNSKTQQHLDDGPKPHHHHHHHRQPTFVSDQRSPLAKQMNVVLFEASVAIHSILIGVDMGVASGPTFRTLLVAICFHQFFEGVAVGTSSQGAFAQLKTSLYIALGFALTTPLGIVIGIFISNSYAPTSVAALWVRGVLHSVAAGILLYTGVVELLTYQFTSNPEFHAMPTTDRRRQYAAIFLGGIIMSAIGYWT